MKNKVLTFLLSLAISFGLWLYVVTVISPEYETTIYNVPVEMVGSRNLDNQDLMIVSNTHDLRVDLTLRGNRADLKKFNSSNITVIADLSQIHRAGEHQISCSVSFQSGTADVIGQKPEHITVTVAEKATKTVPVEVIFSGSVPDGYEPDRDAVELDHATVMVSGPKKTIEQIESAAITVDLTGKMTTFAGEYALTLCGAGGRPIADDSFVTINLEQVRAVVQIYSVKRIPVRFEIDPTASGLREDMVKTTAEPAFVTLIGSSQALDKVGDAIVIPIQLNRYTDDKTEVFLPQLPEGVRCTEEIVVTIEIPDLISRFLTVNRYEFENLPEGFAVQVVENLNIEIWGPKEVLENLRAEHVLCKVDCSNIGLTTTSVPVSFSIAGYDYLYVRSDLSHVAIAVQPVEG
jgi:YbbR domain-containing protein